MAVQDEFGFRSSFIVRLVESDDWQLGEERMIILTTYMTIPSPGRVLFGRNLHQPFIFLLRIYEGYKARVA